MVIFELIYADTSFLSILHRDLKQEFNREKISKASKFRKLWHFYFLKPFSNCTVVMRFYRPNIPLCIQKIKLLVKFYLNTVIVLKPSENVVF